MNTKHKHVNTTRYQTQTYRCEHHGHNQGQPPKIKNTKLPGKHTKDKHTYANTNTRPPRKNTGTKTRLQNQHRTNQKIMHALPEHQWGWWPDWFGPGFAPFRITLQWSTDSASFRQKNFHLMHILGSKTLALAVCVGGRPLTCSGGVAVVACCGTLRQLNIHETSPKIRNN